MIEQLSAPYRKIFAITLLFLMIVIVFGFIVLPIYNMIVEKSDRVDQLEFSIERIQNILSREKNYRTKLNEIHKAPLPKITYNSYSHGALNSQMQNDIRNLIQQSGGAIDNMQSIPPTPEDGFQKIGLRMSLRADTKTLNKILQNIGHHSKLLNFDNISIRTAENQNGTQAPTLTVRWDIYGYGLLTSEQGVAP